MTMGETERELLVRMDERLKGHIKTSGRWQSDMSARTEHIEECVAKDNVRLDRLEQREKSRAKLLWAALTGAVGNAVAYFWSKLG